MSFQPGYIEFKSEYIDKLESLDFLQNKDWDGYVAFSNVEIRYSDFLKKGLSIISGKINGVEGIEGYIMEIGLWKAYEDYCEEIYIERMETRFLFQKYKLYYIKENPNCYWREVRTCKRENIKIWEPNDLSEAIEVVIPDLRMHIFITKK